jgi:hypothetical protein
VLQLPLPFIYSQDLVRGRVPALSDEKGDGFIHNSLHYATANFRINSSTPLHDIAFANRMAINQALKEDDIEAGLKALREISQCGQIMMICEPFQKLYSVSNWCRAWQGLDFSNAEGGSGGKGVKKLEPIVLGLSKQLGSPGRCEYYCAMLLTMMKLIPRQITLLLCAERERGFGAISLRQ